MLFELLKTRQNKFEHPATAAAKRKTLAMFHTAERLNVTDDGTPAVEASYNITVDIRKIDPSIKTLGELVILFDQDMNEIERKINRLDEVVFIGTVPANVKHLLIFFYITRNYVVVEPERFHSEVTLEVFQNHRF